MLRADKNAKVLGIYWYAVLLVIMIVVVSMVGIVFGAKYDTRDIESRILANKIANCVSQGGILNEKVFSSEFKNNFLKNCGVSFGDFENEYYISVEFYDYGSCVKNGNSLVCGILLGVDNFDTTLTRHLNTFCSLDSGKGKLPFCKERSFYAIAKVPGTILERKAVVKIKTIINRVEENV